MDRDRKKREEEVTGTKQCRSKWKITCKQITHNCIEIDPARKIYISKNFLDGSQNQKIPNFIWDSKMYF